MSESKKELVKNQNSNVFIKISKHNESINITDEKATGNFELEIDVNKNIADRIKYIPRVCKINEDSDPVKINCVIKREKILPKDPDEKEIEIKKFQNDFMTDTHDIERMLELQMKTRTDFPDIIDAIDNFFKRL